MSDAIFSLDTIDRIRYVESSAKNSRQKLLRVIRNKPRSLLFLKKRFFLLTGPLEPAIMGMQAPKIGLAPILAGFLALVKRKFIFIWA